jgi:DNA polymerase III alpha subunit
MKFLSQFSNQALCAHFTRRCPENFLYEKRLKEEFELIEYFGFEKVFLQVCEILRLAQGIPHIIRGSAGSSLVCYLLGITNVDPIRENISLARFMNKNRSDIPDIDIDFPYNYRDEIIERLKDLYGDRVARISNHVTFKNTSALREAMRRHGYRRFLPKYFDVHKLMPFKAEQVLKTARELQGQFRGYSLHCGGVIIFDTPVKKELLLKPAQVKINKHQVEEQGLIKIDLLCNRGLAQLWDISQLPLEDYPEYDAATADLFCRGDVLGVTFSESPAMKRLVKAIQPRSRRDIALCLALVRPAAASRGRKLSFLKQWQKCRRKSQIVYDDDANTLISHLLNISDDDADFYRRAFAKGDEIIMAKFKRLIEYMPQAEHHMQSLSMMREYSFCKSHAISYSYLVWALAYWKVRDPKSFWHAALRHCHSMYAQWVHITEAKRAGLSFATAGSNWVRKGDVLYDPKHTPFLFHDGYGEYRKHGYWLSDRFMPGCTEIRLNNKIRVRGLIATYRYYYSLGKSLTFATLGCDKGRYWDIVIEGKVILHKADLMDIEGEVKTFFSSNYIKVTKLNGLKELDRDWKIPQDNDQEQRQIMGSLR